MVDIDPITGLPKELVSFENVVREQQKITVLIEKRKFGKKYTIVKGLTKDANLGEILKKLKTKFACGGTFKENKIELQGNHIGNIRTTMVTLGFSPETIEIKR